MNKLIFLLLVIILFSCNKENNNAVHPNQLSNDEEHNNIILLSQQPENKHSNISDKLRGVVTDNNLRIRSEPDTASEITGVLNSGDKVRIIEKINGIQTIGNLHNFWYKIRVIDSNLEGYVFGGYLDIYEEIPGLAEEFQNYAWKKSYGYFDKVDIISKDDLRSCSWHFYFTILKFTKQDEYCYAGYNSGISSFGKYQLEHNVITFDPELEVSQYDEVHKIKTLIYSTENYFEGNIVLKNDNNSIIFIPHKSNAVIPEKGDLVLLNNIIAEKIWEESKVTVNGMLYALPDIESKNLLINNYYGNKAVDAKTVKLAKADLNGAIWYYCVLDFTFGEPIDGGGPYYHGWLPENYLEGE